MQDQAVIVGNDAQGELEQKSAIVRHDDGNGDHLVMDQAGLYIIRDQRDEYRVAKMLIDTGAVPASFKHASQVMMAIQALRSLGLNWRTALRQCGFSQQGSFTVFGDLELAVVRQSGLLDNIDEFLFTANPYFKEGGDNVRVLKNADGSERIEYVQRYLRRSFQHGNADMPVLGAVCRLVRKGFSTPHETVFTVEDAKIAGLWQKTPTWRNYPGRMMQMRARGVAIRNMFSDVTQGLAGHEYDVEGIEYPKHMAVHPKIEAATETR